jgi:sarcosine oxidase subunit delta
LRIEVIAMLLIACPYCGPRPELEFRYGGEAHIARAAEPAKADDENWTAFLFWRGNPKGLHFERWRHASGCGRFFNCVRDTVSDVIVKTYKPGEPKLDLDSLKAEAER